jgi:hypothetical protein
MKYLSPEEKQDLVYLEAFLKLPLETRTAVEKKYPRRNKTQRQALHSNGMSQIIEEATELARKWKLSIDDVSLDHEKEYDYGAEWYSAYLSVEALESDEQYYSRLMVEHEQDKAREERDRKEFERLQAKFK